jgi:ElaB/YqjD/DUF883 family membrane-anchored ribosome-binding protein
MSDAVDIAEAEARIQVARAKLFSTLGEVQDRLAPKNLAQDAMESAANSAATVARSAAQVARTRPWAVAAVAGAIGLFAARRQIVGLIGGKRDATLADTDSLRSRRASKREKGN